jgi:hypothetical protein
MARYITFGIRGSDAGYWVFEDGHWHHVGGWADGTLVEVQAAMAVMREASQLKTPGLADSVTAHVEEFVGKELAEHVGGDAHTVIIG